MTKVGYGWGLLSRAGHPTAEHGGATSGFRCYVLRMPQDGVYVAVLTNSNNLANILSVLGAIINRNDPGALAGKLAEAALRKD